MKINNTNLNYNQLNKIHYHIIMNISTGLSGVTSKNAIFNPVFDDTDLTYISFAVPFCRQEKALNIAMLQSSI